ncbi:hypothetical protein NAEX_01777 [Nannocystis exedens]|nr:hypothetical protein NAEX_01777 [Nannocystis exedens]
MLLLLAALPRREEEMCIGLVAELSSFGTKHAG